MPLDDRALALASVEDLRAAFTDQGASPSGLLSAQLQRTERWEPSLKASLQRDERASQAAREADAPYDPGSLPSAPPPHAATRRLGVPRSWVWGRANPDVTELFETALGAFRRCGFEIVEVDWTTPEVFGRLQVCLRGPETLHIHAKALSERQERFGPGLAQRTLAGRGESAEDYVGALRDAHGPTRQLECEMQATGLDGLALPTVPAVAPLANSGGMVLPDGRHRTGRGALTLFTAPFNVTGWPALSLPMGLGDGGLPLGLQLVGRRSEDERLLARAAEVDAEPPSLTYSEPPR